MTGNRTKNTNLPLDYHYKPSQATLQMGFWNTDLVNLSVITGINVYTSVRDSVNKSISNHKIHPLKYCFLKYVSFSTGSFPTQLSSQLLHPSVNQCHTLKVIRYLALPQRTFFSSLQPTEPMTRNEMLRVSASCEYVSPLNSQSSIVNELPLHPPKRTILRTDVPTIQHKYLYIDNAEGIIVCFHPVVQSFWTDGPRITASPQMFGGVTLPIQSKPDTASPSLTALKVCQQKFPITQCCGLLPPSTYCHEPRWINSTAIYRDSTVLHKIGKSGVLQCMAFFIYSFHLS